MADKTASDAQPPESSDDFARQAEGTEPGLVREFIDFLREYKVWWMAPIIITLLLLGAIAVLGSGPAAPFIYTLF